MQADPQLSNPDNRDYRPDNTAAHTGAKDLASTGWSGANDSGWFGAVAPNAETGTGNGGRRGVAGVAGKI